MARFFHDMGVIRWPMYVGALFMLAQIGRAAFTARRSSADRSAMTVHRILVWGVLNALLGILGTVLGLALTGRVVERMGADVSPALLAGGIRVALSTSIFGLALLTLAVVAWLILQVGQGSTGAQDPAT